MTARVAVKVDASKFRGRWKANNYSLANLLTRHDKWKFTFQKVMKTWTKWMGGYKPTSFFGRLYFRDFKTFWCFLLIWERLLSAILNTWEQWGQGNSNVFELCALIWCSFNLFALLNTFSHWSHLNFGDWWTVRCFINLSLVFVTYSHFDISTH